MKCAKLINKEGKKVDVVTPGFGNKKGAMIKFAGCWLCGSEIVKINHSTKENEDKVVLGHEITGIIEDINVEIKGFKEETPFKKGDIIAM